MEEVAEGTADIPPVNRTLARVIVLLRVLGWAWLVALVVTTRIRDPEAAPAVLWAAVALATFGMALTLTAARKRFLDAVWYSAADGVIAMSLLAASWVAGAEDFFAGGYPMSWLFIVAFATNVRWTLIVALVATGIFALLHWAIGLPMVRIVGSVQFVVVAVVAGWAFDALRERERLRLEAEAERARAEEQLAVQREEAARLQERSEIARQLHDSVLQTLKLISAASEDSDEVRYLSRVQERDLRRTIHTYRSQFQDGFRARLLDARASVEDRYGVEIEQVIRDDAEMTPELDALVEASQEAMANAARHSGSETIDLYAEVRSDGVQVNVRDRGQGFDPDSVGEGGVTHSIVQRIADVGGTAEIKSIPGQGTDVSLFVSRS